MQSFSSLSPEVRGVREEAGGRGRQGARSSSGSFLVKKQIYGPRPFPEMPSPPPLRSCMDSPPPPYTPTAIAAGKLQGALCHRGCTPARPPREGHEARSGALLAGVGVGEFTVGARIFTYTIAGVPDYSYSITGPKPYSNYSGPYITKFSDLVCWGP